MQISIPIPTHLQLHGGGFEAGFFHPVLGFDHLLAMVAVGIISTLIGGRAIYLVPFSFVAVMIVGSLFGVYTSFALYDEFGIALSVILLGLLIAFEYKTSLVWSSVLVTFFAFFHGHAHGVEIPNASSIMNYITGFMLATILLHILGVFIGIMSQKTNTGITFLSHIGSAMVGIGIYIFYLLLQKSSLF